MEQGAISNSDSVKLDLRIESKVDEVEREEEILDVEVVVLVQPDEVDVPEG